MNGYAHVAPPCCTSTSAMLGATPDGHTETPEHLVEVRASDVYIQNLTVPCPEVADYLRRIESDAWDEALIQMIEIGTLCLERATASRDLDFVRRQGERCIHAVEAACRAIPEQVQQQLVSRIGTDDGQLLAPIQASVGDASRTLQQRMQEVRTLLADDLDPDKSSSALGRSLRVIQELLDANRTDSVQGVFAAALHDVVAEDGTLAKAVKAVVAEAIKPLAEEVNRLAKDAAAQAALAETIEKGTSYEEAVVTELQTWSRAYGAEVVHVGPDNRPGDILVRFSRASLAGIELTLVLEVRDRQTPLGRRAIAQTLAKAIAEREATCAIYLSRTAEGLGRDVGDWGEGVCDGGHAYIATTHPQLLFAIRLLVEQHRLATARATMPDLDMAAVEDQVKHVRTCLGRVATINHKATELRSLANGIQGEAEKLRDEIRNALVAIEDVVRAVTTTGAEVYSCSSR